MREPSRFLVLGSLLLTQILFGIGYLTSKLIVGQWPPLAWAAIRMSVAAALMFLIAFLSGRERPKVDLRFLRTVFLAALFGIAINQGAFLIGLRYTSATNAAVLNALIPLFTVMIVTMRGQEEFTSAKGFGLAFASAGVLLLIGVERFQIGGDSWKGDLLNLVSCLSFATFLATVKPFLSKHDSVWSTAWIFLGGGVLLSLASIPQWGDATHATLNPTLIGCMVFTILGTTILSYFLQFWALAHTRSSHVALFIYLQPVVAALLSWAIYKEEPSARAIGASLLIFVGLVLGLQRRISRMRVAGSLHASVVITGNRFPLLDLSHGGFGFFAPVEAAFAPGRVIVAELHLPGARVIVNAEVRSASLVTRAAGKVRVGCRFSGMSESKVDELVQIARNRKG